MTESTNFTFDTNMFSDLHKDAFGFRPRNHRFYSSLTTDVERQEDWDYVCKCFDAEMIRQKAAEKQAAENFEKLIQDTIDNGASDRETAIRWMFEAEHFSEYDCCYGGSYACYVFSLPNSYTEELGKIMDIMFKAA